MTIKKMSDLLPFVEMPSRYLGSETNIIKKDAAKVKLNFALAFPDLYEIGTSHFGIQILYDILNNDPDIYAQRVFAPAVDMERRMRDAGVPLSSLESETPLADFDVIGFSMLYELNYTNVLKIMDLAGIPFYSSQRDASFPLIIAGGPCMCNPEPVADFFDAIVVGDGEEAALEMARAALAWKEQGEADKTSLLRDWSKIQGVYIPSFYRPEYDENGFQRLVWAVANPNHSDDANEFSTDEIRITKAILPDLDAAAFPSAPIVPFGRPVHDRLRLEVMRGCSRGCRFCQAGMIYRPVRERSMEKLLDLSKESIASTGYDEISLLSLSAGDYSCLEPLIETLMKRHKNDRVAISLPSLRADSLTPELMELIKQVRKTGFTIAPEAGTQRMRDVINKNISEEEIVTTVRNAFFLGWKIIKLYFMAGLPTESDEDLQGIVDLAKRLHGLKETKAGRGKINVSVTPFVPKPHTPFQWASQISMDAARDKIEWLKREIRMPGTQVKWQNPELSILEGLWARGDRRLSKLLEAAYNKGCQFDGWSDKFRADLWKEAIFETGIDIDFFTTRKRSVDEPLPWDHIDMRVDKSFLKDEYQRSVTGEKTLDCRLGDCTGCGVCDFDEIKVREFPAVAAGAIKSSAPLPNTFRDGFFKRFTVVYSKLGKAKYFGHLELVNIFVRAFKRAGIELRHSQGFHPKPKISFGDTLPINIESVSEPFYIETSLKTTSADIRAALNGALPEGLEITDCFVSFDKSAPSKTNKPNGKKQGPSSYLIKLNTGEFDPAQLEAFEKTDECIIYKTSKKGKRNAIDIKQVIVGMDLISPVLLRMEISLELPQTFRPPALLKKIFGLGDEDIQGAEIIKAAQE